MAVIADSTSFKSSARSRNLARRLGLSGFGSWWMRELAAAMPASVRAALDRRRARPVLAFDGNSATLWRPAQANGALQMIESARIALDGDPTAVAAAGRRALAPLTGTVNGNLPQVVVSLSPRASLRKSLALPAALEDHLHQSLAYDLDRHTPFKADELYFDAVVVDRDAVHGTLTVDLAAARRGLVDAVVQQAASFGARVIAVTVDPPAAAARSKINLLAPDRRSAVAGWTRWQFLVPAAILVALAAVAVVLPIWQKREEAIAVNQLSDQARMRAGVSDALRTELEQRVSDYNFALERKYAFPGAVQVLEDVTRILPDDTWLTQLELHTLRGKDAHRELTIRGESANAGRLVSLLEDSKVFTQAAPRSPTTKIQPGPGEIFDVSAHLKAQGAPPAVPIDMIPPAPRPRPAAPVAKATPAVAPDAARAPAAAAGPADANRAPSPPQAGGNRPAPQGSTVAPPPPAGNAPAPRVSRVVPAPAPAPAAAAPAGVPDTAPPPADAQPPRFGPLPPDAEGTNAPQGEGNGG